jgi:hypothetical protein
MFGRESKLPIDLVFQGVDQGEVKEQTHEQFALEWEKSMKEAFEIARANIGKSATYNKKYYDQKAKTVEIAVGDLVLVKNVRERGGTGKLRSYWEEAIFKVTEVDENISVYVLQNLRKSRDVRKLHRNKLMKVEDLPLDTFDEPKTKKPTKTKTKSIPEVPVEVMIEQGEDADSDDDVDAILVIDHGSAEEDLAEDILEETAEVELTEEEALEDLGVVAVPDSSDGEATNGADADSESEDADPELEGDKTIPYDMSSEDAESSGSEEEVRRSTRTRSRAQTFTYDTFGGNPTSVAR